MDFVLKIIGDNKEALKSFEEVTSAATSTANTTKKLADEQQKAFKSGADSAKKTSGAFAELSKSVSVAGVNFSGLTGAIKEKTSALSGAVRGFGLLRTAIAATGIGTLILAISSLISYFKKAEKGAELLERIMHGLGAAMDVIVGAAASIGESIIAAFENPKQALSDFANFLKNNIINRFKAFGVIIEGIKNLDFKQFTNGLLQVGTGVENAIDKIENFGNKIADLSNKAIEAGKAMAEITRRAQDLEDAERGNAIAISENQKAIERLIIASKNRTLSEQQRLKLLEQASALERKNLAIELGAASERIKIIQDENKLKQEAGTLRDEDEQKLVDAIVRRNELEKESLNLQERISNRRDQLLEEEKQKKEKATQDSLEKLQKEQEAKVKSAEFFKKVSEEELKQTQKQTENEVKIVELGIQEAQQQGLISEQEAQEKLAALRIVGLEKQLQNLKDYQDSARINNEEIAAKELEIEEAKLDQKAILRKKDIEQSKALLAVTSDFISQTGSLLGETIGGAEDSLKEFNKKFAIILLDNAEKVLFATVFQSTAQALASADSIATFGISGLIKAAVISGLIKAAFGALKGQINQFHDGGYTGAGGEWDIAGVTHKEEFVSTKKTTAKHRPILEALHREDYSKLSLLDLKPLLEGTGISLSPDRAEYVINTHNQARESERTAGDESAKRLASIEKKMERHFNSQTGKPTRETLPDGTQIIKQGNKTRIIRKKP